MAKPNDQSETESKSQSKRWQGRLLAALLIAAGVVHGFKPQWLTLDWPSIVLILVGVFLLFVPLDDLGTVIETLEIGKTKILFRKVKELDESVNRAEMEAAVIPQLSAEATSEIEGSTTEHRAEPGEFDRQIERLLSADKEMALIRIGVEVERLLAELEHSIGVVAPSHGIVWSRTMRNLQQNGKITPQISRALTDFRDVRNHLIHPSGGQVPEAAVSSAIDSGIKLVRLLANIREMGSSEA